MTCTSRKIAFSFSGRFKTAWHRYHWGDKAVVRLVGALMLKQNDEWAVSRRYMPVEMHASTQHEAAEMIQKIRLDRRMEREVLRNQGMEPIPGGEVVAEIPVAVDPPKRRRWWQVWKKG